MTEPVTSGLHHLGLAVPDLEAARQFFTDALGWRVGGGNPSYPAVFVSDGTVVVTLWLVEPGRAVAFDRRANIGLHHVAFRVADRAALDAVYDKVCRHPGVAIEFAPTPLRDGSPVHHFICAMPGGVRVEFAMAAP